jgi:hypothetical protein
MQIFAIREIINFQPFKKNELKSTVWISFGAFLKVLLIYNLILILRCRIENYIGTHFAISILFLSFTTNIFATDSQPLGTELRRTKSRQPNELLILVDCHDRNDLYLIINDGSKLSTERLAALKRLRGLKIERLGEGERIPGIHWFGGIGQSTRLRSFSNLRVLDLGLPTPRETFKLSREGCAFLTELVHLEQLSLCNHFITTGASHLAGLVKLRRLDLYNNKIGSSISALKTLVNMEVLNLGNNGNIPLDLLKEVLLAMTKLTEVDLSFLGGLDEEMFNEWFTPQIAAGSRVAPPNLKISSAICPIFDDRAYRLPLEGIITVSDFLRELNCLLRKEGFRPSQILPRSECIKPGCLINVLSHKGGGKVRFQKVYDPDHILMNGEVFNPDDHSHLLEGAARKGTRKVGFYSIRGRRQLCIKEAPEAPGLERASRILHEVLFGVEDTGVPNSETIIMNSKVFTVSSYADGKSLDEVIEEIDAKKEAESEEEHQSHNSSAFFINLHYMKVLAILTTPEDGRPQNFLCQSVESVDGKATYRLVGIDNERSFGNAAPHPSRKDPRVIVRGHSVMHCFRERHPNYSDLIKVLCVQTPEDMYKKWLFQIRVEDRYQRAIAPFAKITSDTRLGVPITETIARNLLRKLRMICNGLKEGRILEDIFMEVDRPLAEVYQIVSTETPETPPGVVLKDDSTPPRSCLGRAAKRIRIVDGGRLGTKTPPSAHCEVYGDYLPTHDINSEIEPVMWSSQDPESVIRGWG